MQNAIITAKPRREMSFSSLAKVETHLLEMMEKVKDNPSHIEQAHCMTSVAGRLIDIRKTQIEEAKLLVQLYEMGKIELDVV